MCSCFVCDPPHQNVHVIIVNSYFLVLWRTLYLYIFIYLYSLGWVPRMGPGVPFLSSLLGNFGGVVVFLKGSVV